MRGGPWYATREQVKAASDVKETARLNRAIDRNLAKHSREAERILGWTNFYPWVGTRYFDWPSMQMGDPWDLWLDGNPLLSLTAVTSGGDALTVGTDVLLEPSNDPPYNRIRINSSSSAAWSAGASFFQRAIAATGTWAESNETESAGTLSAALADTTSTAVDVTNSAVTGVGDLVLIGTERMVVTNKQTTDTAVNSSGALAAEKTATALPVPDGTVFAVDEVITIDSERMRIDDITGNTLRVTRAWDGTALAAHNTNSDIYAPRRLIVSGRGFGGTTAATHLLGASVSRWIPHPSLNEWVLAETQNAVAQENAAWARTIGAGESERQTFARGLIDLRKQVMQALGRTARKAVI